VSTVHFDVYPDVVAGSQHHMDMTDETTKLGEILRDLDYPVEKWQITSRADVYGADVRTRRELYGLPARTYGSTAEILEALDS
jgi:hypothetical protein